MNHKDRGAGLGSVLHVGGWYLGYALEHGMLFRWEQQSGAQFVEDGCGRGLPFSNMECLFLSPSACSVEHVTAANSKPLSLQQLEGVWSLNTIPSYLKRLLDDIFTARGVKLSDEYFKYWWRAQSAAYLARFNEQTRRAVATMRKKDDAVLAMTRQSAQDRQTMKVSLATQLSQVCGGNRIPGFYTCAGRVPAATWQRIRAYQGRSEGTRDETVEFHKIYIHGGALCQRQPFAHEKNHVADG